MARDIKNVAASVRDRLLNHARATEREFQLVLTNYALERLLYRLSVSPYRDRFVLKGALLFTIWLDDPFRPTRDLDLLGQPIGDTEEIANVFREILRQPVEDDGLTFEIEGLQAVQIRQNAQYGGVHVETIANLGATRISIQIDIGFGDIVTPKANQIDYPTLLNSPSPRLNAYPRETVVAEKLQALVSIGVVNSRMKDFYDLAMMARYFDFDGDVLTSAVRATFERRQTEISDGMPDGLSDTFALSPQASRTWRGFMARDRLTSDLEEFPKVISELRAFLLPILASARDSKILLGRWSPGGPWQA